MPPRQQVPPIEDTPLPEPDLGAEYGDPYEGMEFEPYDPAQEVEIPLGMPQGGPEETAPEPEPFDERYRDDFEGLMFLGALSASFSHVGHRITIRTLTSMELLAAGHVIKEYQDTIGAPRAEALAIVSLCIQKVDGKPLPIPVQENDTDTFQWAIDRFNYVATHWYPFTVDSIYERYNLLAQRCYEVLSEMAKKDRGQGK